MLNLQRLTKYQLYFYRALFHPFTAAILIDPLNVDVSLDNLRDLRNWSAYYAVRP